MLRMMPLEFPIGASGGVVKLSHSGLHRQFATIFEDKEPRSRIMWLFDTALAVLIVINVPCVILESMESIRVRLAFVFDLLERAATRDLCHRMCASSLGLH